VRLAHDPVEGNGSPAAPEARAAEEAAADADAEYDYDYEYEDAIEQSQGESQSASAPRVAAAADGASAARAAAASEAAAAEAAAAEAEAEEVEEEEEDEEDSREDLPLSAFMDAEGRFHYDVDDTTISVGHGHACVVAAADETVSAPSHSGGGRAALQAAKEAGQGLRPRGAAKKQQKQQRQRQAEENRQRSALLHFRPGGVICWGDDSQNQLSATPVSGTFVQLSAHDGYTCGVRSDARLVCWGDGVPPHYHNHHGWSHDPAALETTADGRVLARGELVDPERAAKERFAQVAAGATCVCGVQMDGTLHCFGKDYFGQASPPPGRFVQVACGWETCCAVAENATLSCWGSNWGKLQAVPPGRFVQVSLSETGSACAVTLEDGDVVCWGVMTGGRGTFYQRTGPYIQVSSSAAVTCAIRQDSTLDCFGEMNRLRNLPAKDATFLEIASHGAYVCGITTDLRAVCWGESEGLTVPRGVVPQV
jgi:hypothetical protein